MPKELHDLHPAAALLAGADAGREGDNVGGLRGIPWGTKSAWCTMPTHLQTKKLEFVSWDDDSQYMGKHVPNHQPVYIHIYIYSKKRCPSMGYSNKLTATQTIIDKWIYIPSRHLTKLLKIAHLVCWFTYSKWWVIFHKYIAMLVYQRVCIYIYIGTLQYTQNQSTIYVHIQINLPSDPLLIFVTYGLHMA